MNIITKINAFFILTALFLAGCGGPAPANDRYQEQQYGAKKAQQELSREVSK